MTVIQKIILGIGLIGFAAGFITQFMLRYHVSIERVREITDPSELYKNCIPPKKVLTDKGRKIHRIFAAGLVTFMASIFILLFLNVGG